MKTFPMRVPVVIACLIVVSACASTGPVAEVESPAAGAEVPRVEVDDEALDLEPYVEEIENALAEIEMIPVPPGSVTVDAEDGPAEIDPFWISRTEVPWELFDVYAFGSADEDEAVDEDAVLRPSRPYGAPDRGYGHRGYAAISMTYLTASEFADWLSQATGKSYRLPTEAEWEYACRAGRTDSIPEDELEERAWYWENAFDKTHPVGELEPNAFGLHDMIGNAAEWCTGLDGEPLACGGSFMNKADGIGCSARMEPSPRWQETDPQIPKSRFWLTDGPFMGFRVIREP